MIDLLPHVGEREWLDPRVDHPPLGVKLFLLTCEGVALIGKWEGDARYCGWHPLFRETEEIKQLRRELRGY